MAHAHICTYAINLGRLVSCFSKYRHPRSALSKNKARRKFVVHENGRENSFHVKIQSDAGQFCIQKTDAGGVNQ